jgi:hypothetical protein
MSHGIHQQHPGFAHAGQQQQQQQQQPQPGGVPFDIPPVPSAPGVRIAYDQQHIPYYDAQIPGIDDGHTYSFRTWEPHVDYFTFSDVKQNKNGGNKVYIKPWKDAFWPARIQCVDLTYDAPLRVPFGISGQREIIDKNGKKMIMGSDERPNLEISFDNAAALEAFMHRIDEAIKRVAAARAHLWFGVEPDMIPLVLKGYKPIVAVPKQKPGEAPKDYRPTMRTKMSFYGEEKRDTAVWRVAKRPGGFSPPERVLDRNQINALLCRNSRVIPIVEITSLWFMQGFSWGATVQLVDVVVLPSEERQRGVFQGMNIVYDDDTGSSDVQTGYGEEPADYAASGYGDSPTTAASASGDGGNAPMDVVQNGFDNGADHYTTYDGPV